jgi:hypothetical protein
MEPFVFRGDKLTVADCELLAFARIGRAHRERESYLFTTKWFDYRHLHPVKATYLFAHRYEECVRAFYSETKDRASADKARAFDTPNVFANREIAAVWIARQAMDAIGCRYEFGIRFALKRFNDRGWRMFPRPNQLYSTEFLLDLRDAWQRQCDAVLELPKHPRFNVAAYEGHPDQDAWQAWAVRQIKRRQHQDRVLSRLFQEELLPVGLASRSFPGPIYDKAVKLFSPKSLSHR